MRSLLGIQSSLVSNHVSLSGISVLQLPVLLFLQLRSLCVDFRCLPLSAPEHGGCGSCAVFPARDSKSRSWWRQQLCGERGGNCFRSGPLILLMDFLAWEGQQQMPRFECGMPHAAVFEAFGLQLLALLSKTVDH